MDSIKDLFKRDADVAYDETPSKIEAGAGFLIGFIGYMYLFPIIIMKILIAINHITKENATEAILNKLSLISQVTAGVIILLVMIFAVSFKKVKNMIKNFDFTTIKLGAKYFLISYLCVFAWNLISMLIFGPINDNANQESINVLMIQQPVLTICLTCVVAPLIEEFIFRYYLYKGLENYNPVWAIVITTFLFAFIHLGASISAGTFVEDLKTLPGYLIPSLIMTVAYYKHHKLGVSYVCHLTNNVFATIMFFVGQYVLPNVSSSGDSISSGIELIIRCLI